MISAVEKVGEDGVEDVADGRRIRKRAVQYGRIRWMSNASRKALGRSKNRLL